MHNVPSAPSILFCCRESVDFVLNELRKMEDGDNNINIDGHFIPYTRYKYRSNSLSFIPVYCYNVNNVSITVYHHTKITVYLYTVHIIILLYN